MKWSRILIVFTAVLLIGGIGMMFFAVYSRMTGMEYQFQVEAVLGAATAANGGQLVTDPEKAVIAEYQGRRAVVAPGNYRALSSYLRKDAAMPLTVSIHEERALKLTVCGEAIVLAEPADEKGDVVLIRLTTGGKTFGMRTDGGNQWASLLKCCMEGTYHDQNQPLD
ncbi:MAG: hypothetical protein II888_06170 [Clostridia bacterium]|nr:hypothetical protein [Clostridia bacterium]